jgi:hypothetical protein
MTETVPNSLLPQVSLSKQGPDIGSQIENGITDSDHAISQLFLYNFHRKASKDTDSTQKHILETVNLYLLSM